MRKSLQGMKQIREYWWMFSLWSMQGIIAVVWLLLIPTTADSFSASRIMLIGLAVFFTLGAIFLVIKSRNGHWPDFSHRAGMFNVAYLVSIATIIIPVGFICILRSLGQTYNYSFLAYAERLLPLVFMSSMAAFEWFLWHAFIRQPGFAAFKPFWKPVLVTILIVLMILSIMITTGWGISSTRDGAFGDPPTPFLEWQIVLSFLLAALFFYKSRWQEKRLDIVLFFLVYVSACLIWLKEPLNPGFFATPPRAPNFEVYPFSDALIYSQYAQSALVGDGFLWPEIPTRPFYVAVLTWLHALVGQDYLSVIGAQTLLLAFFPAFLYLLGKELESRSLGIMLASLAIMRDVTTNRVTAFGLNYSYSKLFFSEVPTALLLVIFTLFALRWVRRILPDWMLLSIGGVLGIAALIRLQSLILLVPMALFAIPVMWKTHRKVWIRSLVLSTLGVALVLTPWLIRNYIAGEGLVLDNPISQYMVLARRWSGDNGNTFLQRQTDETTAQYTSRMTSIALDNLKREPNRILNTAANHFFNSLIVSLQILPVRDQLDSPADLIWPQHAFWQTNTHPSAQLLFLNAVILALGLAYAWQSLRWVGLLPFAFYLAYNAWTALFFSSGARFLIPIDWAWYLYFCMGFLLIMRLVFSKFKKLNWNSDIHEQSYQLDRPPSSWRRTLLTSVVLLVVGSSLPFTEIFFSEKYPEQSREQLAAFLNVPLSENDYVAYGRAIYPRYYEAGDGEPGSAKLGYGESDNSRLVFWMVGPHPGLVIVPFETAPGFFPHASDVWVIGDKDGATLYARTIRLEKDGRVFTYHVR